MVPRDLCGFRRGPGSVYPSIDGFTDLIHPEDRASFWQHLHECVAQHIPFDHEFRIRRPDGTIRWIASRAEFDFDAEGEGVRNFGVAMDITQRKAADVILRENAQLFATIIEHAPGGVFVVDAALRMRSINSEALPMFAPVHPLIGRDLQEILEIL